MMFGIKIPYKQLHTIYWFLVYHALITRIAYVGPLPLADKRLGGFAMAEQRGA